ncbi:MAG: transposon-encoded TnpW family protein [Ruminococcus sp.]|uniref:transposon-encoded TnpW family protein n=1 Tax=Ruminococcus sp. TaxID=41978 RepID=UPI0025DBCEC5|nr:transposon-encoded TnpW family protein [Ruminococcus sp.]MBO4867241.1 transposon-encoded TnpW family protein [Ruminococcus sp.]
MKKTTEQKTSKDRSNSREIKIGDITYTVISHFDDKSNETAEKKIERLISRDIKLY